MQATGIECAQCGSHEYELLDSKTGEVRCPFCRYRWVVPSLIQKSETEKFLELQAEQPRVIIDNTTETNEKLMGMISGLLNPSGCLRQVRSIVAGIAGFIVFVLVAIIVLTVLARS